MSATRNPGRLRLRRRPPRRRTAAVVRLVGPLLLGAALACSQQPVGEARGVLADATGRDIPVDASLAEGPLGHLYDLDLPAQSFVRLVVEQRGLDVEARLLDPRGRPLDRAQGPGGPWLEERLAATTERAGRYRLQVLAPAGAAGRYRLSLEEIRPTKPDDDQRLEAERLFRLGRHQRHTRDHRRAAVESFRQAADLWQRLGDGDRELAARDEWADLLLESGEPTTAGLAVIGPAFDLAQSPQQLARLLETRGWLQADREAQVADFERCLELMDEGAQRADCLDGLGDVYFLADRGSERAGELFAEACRVREAAGDLAGLGTSLSNLAVSKHFRHHDAAEVEALYERSLELARVAQRWPQVSTSLNNLGYFLRYYGRYEEALERFEERFELARRLDETDALGGAYLNLGTVFAIRGRTGMAIENLERALEIYRRGEDPEEISEALHHLGWAHDALGDHQRAHDHFAEASELDPEDPWLRVGLGRALTLLERPREGLEVLEAAYGGLGEAGRRCHAMLEIGTARSQLGDVAGARAAYRTALDLAVEAGHSRDSPRFNGFASLARLGRLEAEQGNLAAARRYLEEALEAREQQSTDLRLPEDRASFRELGYVVPETYVGVLVSQHRRRPTAGHDVEALVASERARARALAEWLTEAQIEVTLTPALEAAQRDNARAISMAQKELGRLLSQRPPDPPRITAARVRLEALKRDRSRLISEIRETHPEYAEITYPDPIGLEEIRTLLPPGSALLQYFVGRERSFLFVVRQDRLEIVDLAAAEVIQQAVAQARRLLDRGRRLQELAGTRQAYELLIAPAEAHLEGIERLVVSPDRNLHYLPFEALWISPRRLAGQQRAASTDFLISRFTVTYTPSASTLAYVAPRHRPARFMLSAFAFSGPDDRIADGRAFGKLEHAATEVSRIAALFPTDEVRMLVGADASEGAVKASVGDSRLLHIAVHGAISEDAVRDSALLFGASEEEDGLLQVAEIFGLDLSADLVVLSACETALGREIRGEGLLGLSHAFFTAGARSLVVSLWKVDDRSTERLMTTFYAGLTAGLDSAAAVRQAKIALIDGDVATSHPYYWAPFILVGPSEVL